ncbi:MAG: J domain-containing protein [Armatimonadota bacterium]|nr:hypothetical protein [bacterium]
MGILRRISLIIRGLAAGQTERLDEIARDELSSVAPTQTPVIKKPVTLQPMIAHLAADYRTLGVEPDADLDAVETAWRALASRADPKRFPAGSDEEKRAAAILDSINEAYARIREELNPTEGRFGRLEL